jgi:hypothetical protein
MGGRGRSGISTQERLSNAPTAAITAARRAVFLLVHAPLGLASANRADHRRIAVRSGFKNWAWTGGFAASRWRVGTVAVSEPVRYIHISRSFLPGADRKSGRALYLFIETDRPRQISRFRNDRKLEI